jgi:hypothetical protein
MFLVIQRSTYFYSEFYVHLLCEFCIVLDYNEMNYNLVFGDFLRAPKLLDRLKGESEVKIIEEQGVEACSLACTTLRVKRHARAPIWD